MRERSRLLARLLAFPWLAAILVLGAAVAARADERASATLRFFGTAEGSPTAGSQPGLASNDLVLYRHILDLQAAGEWDDANRLIARLDDGLLLGHLQAQRYLHPTAYRSTYGELARWLDSYADLPEAGRIYKLALKRRPVGAQGPNRPTASQALPHLQEPFGAAVWRELDGVQFASLTVESPFTDAELADPRTARLGRDEEILRRTGEIWERKGSLKPLQDWTAGLAAWRLDNHMVAARHFSALANSADAEGEDVAAGAFWAARAWRALGRQDLARRFLRIAAYASDGFYGLIARTLHGQSIDFDFAAERTVGDIDPRLLRFPATRRALALAQVEERQLAGQELSLLASRLRPELAGAVLALAAKLSLPDAELRAARQLHEKDGRDQAAALFPAPAWKPTGGFTVDRALLWAISRAESGFDADAVSPKGAVGLMQIMPETAEALARKLNIPYNGQESLLHPETNLRFGQAYLQKLRRLEQVGDSLIHLCLAYNAGVARLEAWENELGRFASDPLLFLESVPMKEPRQYVKSVLVNLWAYRARLGQPSASLTELARNEWPVIEVFEVAERKRRDARES